MSRQQLDGKRCLVTGSTRGIGLAIARRFVAEGGLVSVHGTDQTIAAAVCEQIGAHAAVAVELGEPAAAEQLVAEVVRQCGGIDVLVNCAGIARDRFISRLTDDDWSESLAVNLSTPFYLTRSVVPLMKAQGGGNVLNVLSYAGFRGNAGQAAYSSSKAGLDGLTKTAAKELARFGIRVNALSPIVETDMTRGMTDERRVDALSRIPLGRFGDGSEAAEGAVFLVSDLSHYVTGQVLHVDGGMHLM